jgi:hypothetical protein
MTHERGFHMKLRNCGQALVEEVVRRVLGAYLEQGTLLLLLKLIMPKETDTARGLFSIETLVSALEEGEDIVDDNSLKVDFFLII